MSHNFSNERAGREQARIPPSFEDARISPEEWKKQEEQRQRELNRSPSPALRDPSPVRRTETPFTQFESAYGRGREPRYSESRADSGYSRATSPPRYRHASPPRRAAPRDRGFYEEPRSYYDVPPTPPPKDDSYRPRAPPPREDSYPPRNDSARFQSRTSRSSTLRREDAPRHADGTFSYRDIEDLEARVRRLRAGLRRGEDDSEIEGMEEEIRQIRMQRDAWVIDEMLERREQAREQRARERRRERDEEERRRWAREEAEEERARRNLGEQREARRRALDAEERRRVEEHRRNEAAIQAQYDREMRANAAAQHQRAMEAAEFDRQRILRDAAWAHRQWSDPDYVRDHVSHLHERFERVRVCDQCAGTYCYHY